MEYYLLHIGDWRSATCNLTRMQRDIYRSLLDTYYDQEHPLTADFDMLAEDHGCRVEEEKVALRYVLKRYFRFDGEVYRNDRADEELAAFHHKIEVAKKAGRISVGVRAQRKMNAKATVVPAKNSENSSTVAMVESDSRNIKQKGGEIEREVNERSTSVDESLQKNAVFFNDPSTTHNPLPNTSPPSKPDGLSGGEASSTPTAAAQPADPNRSKPVRKCPKTFTVTPQMIEWASAQVPLLAVQDIERETATFKDHTFGNAISDWSGAWRNWMRKEQKFREQRAPRAVAPAVSAREQERQRITAGLYGNSKGANNNGSHEGAIDVESRVVRDPETDQSPADEDS